MSVITPSTSKAAALAQRGLDVNLPQEARRPTARDTSVPTLLEYTAYRKMSTNKQDVAPEQLAVRLRSVFEDRRDKTMFIATDGGPRYGDIVFVIDTARGLASRRSGL